MKKRKIIAGILGACLFLAGCDRSDNTSGDKSSDVQSNTNVDYSQFGLSDSVPREIDGFTGNVSDVQPKAGDLIAEFEIEGFGTIKAVLFPEAAPLGVENFQKLADSGFYDGLTIHRVVSDFMFQGGSTNGDGTGGDAAVNGGSFGVETAQNARHFYGALCYANAAGQNTTQFYIVNNKKPQDISTYDLNSYREQVEDGKQLILSALEQGVSAEDMRYAIYSAFGQDLLSIYQNYQNIINWVGGATDNIVNRYKEKGGTPSLDGGYTVFGQTFDGFDVIDKISSVSVQDNGGGEKSKPVETIVIKTVKVRTFDPDIDTVSGSQSGEDSQSSS